jgi:hypothetical protein
MIGEAVTARRLRQRLTSHSANGGRRNRNAQTLATSCTGRLALHPAFLGVDPGAVEGAVLDRLDGRCLLGRPGLRLPQAGGRFGRIYRKQAVLVADDDIPGMTVSPPTVTGTLISPGPTL